MKFVNFGSLKLICQKISTAHADTVQFPFHLDFLPIFMNLWDSPILQMTKYVDEQSHDVIERCLNRFNQACLSL